MPDKTQPKHRTNRVFKSLHKPLTYLGVERTLFYFLCVGAVGAFIRTDGDSGSYWGGLGSVGDRIPFSSAPSRPGPK